jgi:O-antigen ligase
VWDRIPGGKLGAGVAVLIVLAVLLGGASRGNALRLSLLELASLPLLGVALIRLWTDGSWRRHRFALALAAAAAAVPLIQLIPLPPGIWQSLPGREQAVLALEVAGLQPGWSRYSLTPDLTLRSALALLPPMSVFLAVLALPRDPGRDAARLWIGLTVAGLTLGIAQVAVGAAALHPWPTSEAGEMTGFFANRNHLATMVLTALPFCGLMIGRRLRRGDDGRAALWLWAGVAALLAALTLAIQSRAGVVLLLPILALSALVAHMASGRAFPGPKVLAVLAAGFVGVAALGWFGGAAVLDRFQSEEAERRLENWPLIVEAAQTHLPAGAGMGSFDRVFRTVEPLEDLDATYFNSAHNDYLETWLEAGWLATAILIAFLIWFGRRVLELWRDPRSHGRAAPAAAVAIVAVLVHSAVDYPLRTVTLTVLFALCCALLERRADPARRERR